MRACVSASVCVCVCEHTMPMTGVSKKATPSAVLPIRFVVFSWTYRYVAPLGTVMMKL